MSHPVGTTVAVTEYLKHLPVRRQTAIKEKTSASQLGKIKRMLQAYALARPYVRFSLRMFKAKTDKSNWSYAPNHYPLARHPTVASGVDAAVQIFGKRLTDQCQWFSWTLSDEASSIELSTREDLKTSSADAKGYRFEALLPKAGTLDFSVVATPRQFISIDSRPVSCARGSTKQIVSKFKKCFRNATLGSNNDKSIDPFLYFHIVCPEGCYDANVEPAKDVLLFNNHELVVTLADIFFQQIYGKSTTSAADRSPSPGVPQTQGFDILLAKEPQTSSSSTTTVQRPPRSPTVRSIGCRVSKSIIQLPSLATRSPNPNSNIKGGQQPPVQVRSVFKRTMYDDSETDDDQAIGPCDDPFQPDPEGHQDDDDVSNDITLSNPWIIAKLNTSKRESGGIRSNGTTKDIINHLPTPRRQRGDISTSPILSFDKSDNAETPQYHTLQNRGRSSVDFNCTSSPPFSFPPRSRTKRQPAEGSLNGTTGDGERYTNGALDSWVQKSPDAFADDAKLGERKNKSEQQRPCANEFVSARTLQTGTALEDIPDTTQRHRKKSGARNQKGDALNQPSISPVNDPHRVWFECGEHRPRPYQRHARPDTISNTPQLDAVDLRDDESEASVPTNASARPTHPDLALTLDYEARKQKASKDFTDNERRQALERKEVLHAATKTKSIMQTSTPPSSSPHNNRYVKAAAALQPPNHSSQAPSHTVNALQEGDARLLLIREQACAEPEDPRANHKPRVSKHARRTAMLPLETTREEDSVRELLLRLNIKPQAIGTGMQTLSRCDDYITSGKITEALITPPNSALQIGKWEAKLKQLLLELCSRKQTPNRDLLAEVEIRNINLSAAFRKHPTI